MNHDKAMRQIKKSRKDVLNAEILKWKMLIFNDSNNANYQDKISEFNARKRLLRTEHAEQIMEVERRHKVEKASKKPALSQAEIQRNYRNRIKTKNSIDVKNIEYLKNEFEGKSMQDVSRNLRRNINEGNYRLALKKMDYLCATIRRKHYRIEDLMAEMPNGLPRAEGWDEMQAVGLELI